MSGTKQLVTDFIESLERRDWETWSSLLDRDVVYEIPQTRERIRGRDQYLRFNREFPGDWHLTLRVAIADEGNGVAWFVWEVDDAEPVDAMAFFTFSDGLIASVTDFWPKPYDPPSGREHLVERW